MKSDWESAQLGSLLLEPQRNGLSRPKKDRGNGLPMVNMGELFANHRIKNIEMDLVPVNLKEKHFILEAGDLLFARQSLVLSGAGKCSIFLENNGPTVFESHLIRCRLDKTKSNPLYYFYFFSSSEGRKVIEQIVEQGAGASGIRGSDLVNLFVPIPPKDTQDKIANLLNALDDRITLLRETNTTLEAIAQALFKSWFIDFDPVHAKMQGQSPEGMDEATAALFPDSFDETESGPVPKGWEWKSLKEAYQINPNRQLKKGQSSFYLDMANVNNTGHGVRNLVQREMGSGTKFVNGDTLLARITPCLENGKTAFVDFLPDATTGWGSTEFVVLRPKSPLPTYHAYLLARHASFREHAIRSMSGTSGRQRIQNDVLSQFLIAIPSEKVVVAFNEIITTLQERIQKSNTQANQLSEIRNLLLPHLISGKLLTCKNLETSNT